MENKIIRVGSVEYTEKICETRPLSEGHGTYSAVVGNKRKRCKVEVVIDLAAVIRSMGARAARSKGGKCVDGFVTVKRIGTPEDVS